MDIGAAHLAEVDDAAVAASVSVDVGDVQIAMGQLPAEQRSALLGGGQRVQNVQLPLVEQLTQPAWPGAGQVRSGELAVAGQFGGQLPDPSR
jgi:hypothetical protein